jgi:hypothetical protein
MDLCRDILLQVEADDKQPLPSKWTGQQMLFHVELLNDAGLLEAQIVRESKGELSSVRVKRLTWLGHEYLDAMRDNTVWAKAKDAFLTKGTSWTFDLLKEVLAQVIANQIGLPSR